MNIDKMIEQWEEKHSSLLNDYSKGNANNEVMQMYRSQMKNVLDFIEQLKQVKNNFVLADVMRPLPSDEEIERWVNEHGYYGHCTSEYHEGLEEGAKWIKKVAQEGNAL